MISSEGIKIAVPEKALLDVFYLSSTRSRLFTKLPELEIPKKFSWKRAYEMAKKLNPKKRTLVLNQLNTLKAKSEV